MWQRQRRSRSLTVEDCAIDDDCDYEALIVTAVVALLMCLPFVSCASDSPLHSNMYMKTGYLVPDTLFDQTGCDSKIVSTFKCMVGVGLLY